MVAILTIVSTVCGAWAIRLAIQALDVSVESRDISLKGVGSGSCAAMCG